MKLNKQIKDNCKFKTATSRELKLWTTNCYVLTLEEKMYYKSMNKTYIM